MCRLKIPCLDTMAKWQLAVSLYVKDLQFVQSEYNGNKQNPPLARNLPPIAGKIAWVRQLYRRISGPVEAFQHNSELMKLAETKKAIRVYNRLARVLVEYELVFLKVWACQIDQARASLNVTVLIKQQHLVVNMDKNVGELLREISVMSRMGLELPLQARAFMVKALGVREKEESIRVSESGWLYIYK